MKPRQRTNFRLLTVLSLCTGILIAGLTGSPAAADCYPVIDLAPLGGLLPTLPDINTGGSVVGGFADAGGADHPFLWENGLLKDLSRAYSGWRIVSASGINDAGWIVGTGRRVGDPNGRAVLLRDGTVLDLGTLGGKTSAAVALNSSGWIIGTAENSASKGRAFLWRDVNRNGRSDPGDMRDLGSLGGETVEAWSVNNRGWVVGNAQISAGDTRHAFLWKDSNGNGRPDHGEMQDLGTFRGGRNSYARGINDAGQIAGWSEMLDVNGKMISRAFLLTPEDTNRDGQPDRWFRSDPSTPGSNRLMKNLGTLVDEDSYGYGINASGQVTGVSFVNDAGQAFVWDDVHGMRKLYDMSPDVRLYPFGMSYWDHLGEAFATNRVVAR